ncbi:MAG: hypothetical protein QOJ91_689 [Sphingomonadales bacterium]|jgi:hypothetical protein|nr:hypothetical protein [Sphingomonadales bacterium]
MIKFGVAASALIALSAPVCASVIKTTEIVRHAVCVTIEVTNPDGSGSSDTHCETNSAGKK